MLTNEFLKRYDNLRPNWGPLGEVTFYRTYSRWLPDKSRRESWTEVITRVVNCSVEFDDRSSQEELKAEAESLFDTIWNMRAFPAGRTLWVGGTETAKANGLSHFNCSHHFIESFDDLHDLVVILMHGAGGGLGLSEESVKKFADHVRQYTGSDYKVTPADDVVIAPYEYVGVVGNLGSVHLKGDTLHFQVTDSREGWAQFVRDFMKAYFSGYRIEVNLNNIRPLGTPLKTFGGFASGPQALIDWIETVLKVTQDATEVTTIMLLDICTAIGRMVVSGGTRRSALIALSDSDNEPYKNAKVGEWYNTHIWRTQANNSIMFDSKPSREEMVANFAKVMQFGEPGLINREAARKRRPSFGGLNACFTGDTRLLTENGWVTFRDAAEHGLPIKIIQDSRVTYEGDDNESPENWKVDPSNTDEGVVAQASHAFVTRRDADIIRVEFSNGSVLRLTPDHLIATTLGMVEAQHLTSDYKVLAIEKIVGINKYKPATTTVVSITPDGKEDVYCLHENVRRTVIVEGICARRCAEILLPTKGFCNLVTFNIMRLTDGIDELVETDIRNIVRHNMRITQATVSGISPQWDINQKSDRLLGVSFTGYGDYVAVHGEEAGLELLRYLKVIVDREVDAYAYKLRIPRPLLVTTVKPEGTVTLLCGAASGLHDPYAPYYIRRIRVSSSDAVATTLIEMGVHWEPDATGNNNTLVFSFPVKTKATKRSDEKSAVEQLTRYFNIMSSWVDHNASNTIYIAQNEIDDVIDLLLSRWDDYIAVSFLAKMESKYPQLPFEAISEEEYNKMMESHPDLSDFASVLEAIEISSSASDDLEGCDVGGSCPVR